MSLSLAEKFMVGPVASILRKNNPHLSEAASEYMAKVVVPITTREKDPQKAAVIANREFIKRLKDGDAWARVAVTEDLLKYRPTYEAAVAAGKDPVVDLSLEFAFGREVAEQHVEMFRLIDGK